MTMQGILIFKYANKGSHSEGVFPYLYRGYGDFVRMVLIGDIPFENPILRKYDGKPVSLEGDFDLNNVFLATSVTEMDETVLPSAAPSKRISHDPGFILPDRE